MNKILKLTELQETTQSLHDLNKRIVLVGGCFDILHQGHIRFLDAAKKQGDVVILMLESDAAIRKRKGSGRPVNTQAHRASILAALASVDLILLLPDHMTDAQYDTVVLVIKPAIIATTKGDAGRNHKERQAARVDADVIDVIERLPAFASSALAQKLSKI
jgi:FAD synthetase